MEMGEYSDSKARMIVVIVLLIVVALVYYFYFYNNEPPVVDVDSADLNSDNIGTEIFSDIEKGEEVVDGALPDTNPFSDQGTNPFDNYKNPFGE